jgi:hypothetical protein
MYRGSKFVGGSNGGLTRGGQHTKLSISKDTSLKIGLLSRVLGLDPLITDFRHTVLIRTVCRSCPILLYHRARISLLLA